MLHEFLYDSISARDLSLWQLECTRFRIIVSFRHQSIIDDITSKLRCRRPSKTILLLIIRMHAARVSQLWTKRLTSKSILQSQLLIKRLTSNSIVQCHMSPLRRGKDFSIRFEAWRCLCCRVRIITARQPRLAFMARTETICQRKSVIFPTSSFQV